MTIYFLDDSRPWHKEPRTWLDVLRCRLGRHRRIMRAFDANDIGVVCRCSCGATEFDWDDIWVAAERIGRRKART